MNHSERVNTQGGILHLIILRSTNHIIFVLWLIVTFSRENHPLESWIWCSFFINVTLFFFSLSFYLEEFKISEAPLLAQCDKWRAWRDYFSAAVYTNVISQLLTPWPWGKHLSLSPTHTDVDLISITSKMYVQALNLWKSLAAHILHAQSFFLLWLCVLFWNLCFKWGFFSLFLLCTVREVWLLSVERMNGYYDGRR